VSGINYHGWTHKRKIFGGTDPIPPDGVAQYEIKVFFDDEIVVTGDGRFWWPIPEDLDEGEIIKVAAGVSTESSSGSIQIQLRHFTADGTNDNGDILSTKINIDSGDMNSRTAATQPVISGLTWPVSTGDWLRCDVDNAGGGDAMGLVLLVTIAPTFLGSVLVEGSQGPPGGVTSWTGQWATSTGYTTGQSVSNNGSSYVAVVDHTSGAASEPGVGANWEDFWQLLSEHAQSSSIECVINGNGRVIDVGPKAYIEVPFDCTLYEVVALADFPGSAQVDIWKDTYANYPPINADSITGASPVSLVAANKSQDSTLAGWTTTFVANDILAFNVDSCSQITILTISLKVLR
jgi:hypothetical protein